MQATLRNSLAALLATPRVATRQPIAAASRLRCRGAAANSFRIATYSTTPTQTMPQPPKPDGGDSGTRSKGAVGPFTLRAGAVFAITGVGLYFYFQKEKRAVADRKAAETAATKVGRPKIGGNFVLTDQNGQEWSSEKMKGKWSLVYFGFTNCPDICPEELDKMGLVVSKISKTHQTDILPIFITCDPARDDVTAVKAYVKDFHPALVGLTGTYEKIKQCCKAYRVYFSTPPNAKATDDYLVDHSIFFYLMDPNGKFVDAFGRSMGPNEVEGKIGNYIDEWNAGRGRDGWTQ